MFGCGGRWNTSNTDMINASEAAITAHIRRGLGNPSVVSVIAIFFENIFQ